MKERLLANQKRFRTELKGLRPKHIEDYLVGEGAHFHFAALGDPHIVRRICTVNPVLMCGKDLRAMLSDEDALLPCIASGP